MAGNTPNVAPNNVQDQSYEQTQESTIAQIKSAVSDKLNRLCDTIKGCAATGALALTLAATPVNAQQVENTQQSTESVRRVDPAQIVEINGKNYTYGELYKMPMSESEALLDAISDRRTRIRTTRALTSLAEQENRELVVLLEQARAENQQARAENQQARAENQQARAENQQARAENQQSRELNQLITIVSDKTRPITERRHAFDQFQKGVRNSPIFTEEQKQRYYEQFPMIAQMLNR